MPTMLKPIEPSATSYSVEWRQVAPDDLPGTWPLLADMLRLAIERGDRAYNEADILAQCLLHRWQVWVAWSEDGVEALLITDVMDFPRMRKCLVRYAAGDAEVFARTFDQLEGWAKSLGCHMIEAYGRKGWQRLIPGWNDKYVVLQRKLI